MVVSTLPKGFVLRAPALDEAAAVADLMNAVEIDITGRPDTNADRVRWQWERPGIDLERDVRVIAEADGSIVGYVEYEGYEPWTQLEADGSVSPTRRGLGLGTALQDWVMERATEDAAKAREGERVVMLHFLWVDDRVGRSLLEARGWQPCRWFYWMIIDLDGRQPEPGRIEGIEIRPMRSGEEHAVYLTDDESFRDHWGYVQEPYEEWFHRHMGRDDFIPELTYVAMDGDEMVGCSVNLPTRDEDPEKGWVQSLAVRRPWRRRGIARALLLASFRAMQERGCKRAGLGVDAENTTGAVALYEQAGMRVEREAVSYELELRPAAG